MRPIFFLVLVVGTFFLAIGMIASAGDAKDAKAERDMLIGTWQAITLESGGKKLPDGFVKASTFVITSEKLAEKFMDSVRREFTYTLDAAKKPKQMDWTDAQGQKRLAIYELDGDTLKICNSEEKETPRPTEFLTRIPKSKTDTWTLVILKRVKK
jgi:uncharacterized protein (TIGR03067 family)